MSTVILPNVSGISQESRAGQLGTVKVIAPQPKRANIAPEMRAYFCERRRALLTELDALNKLLGMTTK